MSITSITAPAQGEKLAVDRISTINYTLSKIVFGAADEAQLVSSANPLPVAIAGAATAAKQDDIKAAVNALAPYLDNVEGLLSALGNLISSVAYYPATQPVSGTFFQTTQPVSAASLPLPTGAATDAKLDAIIAKLIAAPATAAKQETIISALQATAPADDLFAITPSDSVALTTIPKALLVTVSGNVSVRGTGSAPVVLAVTAGQILPIRARYVYATNTTATVVGLI